ncbi:MAG: hypothetical protein GQ477_05670 [Nanohaloarchaea archaeon]|nr:hypothetical protein [Candidatus Nanohaloarchaea archaeon]
MVVEKEIKLVNPKFSVSDVYYICDCTGMESLKVVDTYMVPNGSDLWACDKSNSSLVRIREIDNEPYLTIKGSDRSSGVYKEWEEFEVPVTPMAKDAIFGLGSVALVIEKQRYVFEGGDMDMIYDAVYGVSIPDKDILLSHDSDKWYNLIQTNIFEVENITDKGLDWLFICLRFSKDDLTTVSNYDYFMELISKLS